MISSETAIYNLALNAIGARNNVSSPSEASREAEVCNLWYSAVRDQIFEAAPWPEATKLDYLAVMSEQDDTVWTSGEAIPGSRFTYSRPSDMIRPQYLTDFSPFQITGTVVNTNAEQAIMVYTFRNTLVTQWSSSLQMAIVYGLAAHICMPLTGKTQRARTMLEQANQLILQARENSSNTNTAPMLEALPEWLAGRGYYNTQAQRYVYPYGPLLVMQNV